MKFWINSNPGKEESKNLILAINVFIVQALTNVCVIPRGAPSLFDGFSRVQNNIEERLSHFQ